MADLGTIVSKVTTITTAWFQDVNNSVYRAGTSPTPIDTSHHAAPSKATPVDADEISIADSALSFSFARLTFANLRAQLFSLFGAQLNASTSKTTPTGADSIPIQDSAATNATKQLTITNLLTYLTSALTPTNAVNATNVTTTINNGVVATTQAVGDSSTKVATDAFVMLRPVIATPQASTSGTSITFSSIPTWVKRITINFKGVGTNGTSLKQVQIGSGAVVTTGYLSVSSRLAAASLATSAVVTTGYVINSAAAADRLSGSLVLALESAAANSWILSGSMAEVATAQAFLSAGSISLAGALDRVVITTVNGTDAFAAGEINIMYE